ncbi:DUF4190 domain-containing protein [Rhodococcus marinonascens]|uniref:DUF4190 domain-containing protein n=1 Tax=Rhodococcus marinonascens TaxID=38311 RepID=UPI000ABB17B7|nr:DUF4190 domain-containing protein [Rhodococcus marinonascens]
MTHSGGSGDLNPYNGQTPQTYGETPPLPRDGYGDEGSGYSMYSAPTEKYPDYNQPGGYGTAGIPGEHGTPNPYGAPNPYRAPHPQKRGTNRLAIASLITSIVGIILGIILSIVGIILGMVALGQIQKSGEEGRGLAIFGIVIGVIVVVLFLLLFVVATTVTVQRA